MHPNPSFRRTDLTHALAFIRDRAFGQLCINGDDGPLISYIPFLLNDAADMAELHLVRSNPIARITDPIPAVIAVSGPDAYISPDWYNVPDQVPTWNYIAVHLRGTLEPSDVDMHDLLDRQTAAYEDRLDKAPWLTSKMSDGVMEKMMRQILPFRFHISDIQSTFKLGQNKPDQVRIDAANQLETGLGSELTTLATLMRDPPQD
ncbi:FMN-binding negative transcriptional regulator [Cognatishimia sp. MH4019]|uniref:FMN-binding negative transcriptional regulator n=1 Tax=Cognatishimia sp. MH4019 TaxID=2854030 RepID=UPI001CD6DA24|nr:FMN-binding negative transcriptional regulator [Cognatishimia sp. MH4019]